MWKLTSTTVQNAISVCAIMLVIMVEQEPILEVYVTIIHTIQMEYDIWGKKQADQDVYCI